MSEVVPYSDGSATQWAETLIIGLTENNDALINSTSLTGALRIEHSHPDPACSRSLYVFPVCYATNRARTGQAGGIHSRTRSLACLLLPSSC